VAAISGLLVCDGFEDFSRLVADIDAMVLKSVLLCCGCVWRTASASTSDTVKGGSWSNEMLEFSIPMGTVWWLSICWFCVVGGGWPPVPPRIAGSW